jgi:hypothetical protein
MNGKGCGEWGRLERSAPLRPDLLRKLCISAKKSLRLLSIIAQLPYFRVKSRIFT